MTGRRDSNPLPPAWKAGALANVSYCRVAGVGLEPTQRPEGSSAYETDEHAAAPPRYACWGKASNLAPSDGGATSARMLLPVELPNTRVEEFVRDGLEPTTSRVRSGCSTD